MLNLIKGIVFVLALIGTYKVWQEGNYLTNFLHFYAQIFNGTFFNQLESWSNQLPSFQSIDQFTNQLPSFQDILDFLNLK